MTEENIPKSISELQAFAYSKGLPIDDMHFHIGENYAGPKAFGIYQDDDTGEFVVYKNKSDGSRAIRYRGYDEEYAVSELYAKMHEVVVSQREYQQTKQYDGVGINNPATFGYSGGINNPTNPEYVQDYNYSVAMKSGRHTIAILYLILTVIIIALIFVLISRNPSVGYYEYDGDLYYCRNSSSWYRYDTALNDWTSTYVDPDSTLYDDYYAYYSGNSYSSDYSYDYGASSIKSSDYWDSSWDSSSSGYNSYDDDDDYDWSWGNDSWDDSSYDWDSDW
jgi:hypothetical protein